MKTCSFLVLAIAAICSFQIAPVAAWGKDGHEIVGNLAWRLISNDTQRAVKDILRQSDGSYGDDDDAGSPLASVADWADTARYSKGYSWTAPLHYIDVHDELIAGGCPVMNRTGALTLDESFTCQFDYARDCADDQCVAGAIVNYTSQLTPTGVEPKIRGLKGDPLLRESLMFLVHFVGDIHQPLHCSRESDRGGNTIDVHFNRSSSTTLGETLLSRKETPRSSRRGLRHSHHSDNLHSVWDSSIIEKSMRDDYAGSREAMEDDLFNLIRKTKDSDEWKQWMDCPDGASRECTSQWGEESLDYALTWAYSNVDGTEVKDGDELSTGYYETRLPIVQERLAVAGLRLAVTLEIQLAGSGTVAIL